MGTFHTRCKIENPTDRSRCVVIPKVLLDTGSEFTWVSERMLERIGIRREKKDVIFVLANGQEVTRSIGFAIIRLDKFFTIDEVVFAEPGDLALLGARTLEGLNLIVEPTGRRLVVAGPLPAASPTHPRSRSHKPRAGPQTGQELTQALLHLPFRIHTTSLPRSRLKHCTEPPRSNAFSFPATPLGLSARFCSHWDLPGRQ
jgi:predicted aspartyl protease